jgi:hypothetical protein
MPVQLTQNYYPNEPTPPATYNVHMNVTRRTLAKIVAAAAVPVSATAQSDADEETRSAHDALRNNAAQIAKVEVPMATEPAFHFKA